MAGGAATGRLTDMDRVSVVVTCFNDAAHVAGALASVVAQTRAPDEILVVDDGSTDDSRAIVRAFGHGVRLLERRNGGAAAARNTGVAAATGRLIAFLDADDLWPADSLGIRLGAMARSGAELVYGGVRQWRAGADDGPVVAGRLAGAMLVRAQVFARVGPFNERLPTAETIDWVARADEAGIRSLACPELVLLRRIHGDNLMIRSTAPNLDCLGVLRGVVRRRQAAA